MERFQLKPTIYFGPGRAGGAGCAGGKAGDGHHGRVLIQLRTAGPGDRPPDRLHGGTVHRGGSRSLFGPGGAGGPGAGGLPAGGGGGLRRRLAHGLRQSHGGVREKAGGGAGSSFLRGAHHGGDRIGGDLLRGAHRYGAGGQVSPGGRCPAAGRGGIGRLAAGRRASRRHGGHGDGCAHPRRRGLRGETGQPLLRRAGGAGLLTGL